MSEMDQEQQVSETNPPPGGKLADQPAEGDKRPGDDGRDTEEAETQADLHDDSEPQKIKNSEETGFPTDVSETVEEGSTLREPRSSDDVGNAIATVKLVLVPEGHVMTVAFAIGLTIRDLKQYLASKLRVPAEVLQISLDGTVVEEQQSLMDLGVRPQGSTRMEMSSTNLDTHPLRPLQLSEDDSMQDVLTVQVQTDEGVFQEVVVEIERPRQQKAFLGGYRHRLTGVEYHHATVQTLPKRRPDRGVEVFTRDTQTAQVKSQMQQCQADISTQMTRIGCYVSCLKDQLVTPGCYFTADEYHNQRLRAVIHLQSFVRRWLAQQKVNRLRIERDRRLAWLEMQERRRKEEREEQMRDRHQRWMNPQHREDFNLLYCSLAKWRSEEEQRINSTLRGAERKAALWSLLDQEMKHIAAIGRQHIAAQDSNYNKSVRNLLDKSAATRQWRAADGRMIEMDTQEIIRARELRNLYNSVSLTSVSEEQRLWDLMRLKQTVQEHECQLTQYILDLIDREVDLMERGVKTANLEGLRKRICTVFLQYIKTPTFNPEVAKFLKVPQNPSQQGYDMVLCQGCHRYLLSAHFKPPASSHQIGRCRNCIALDNTARTRDEFSVYKNILTQLRADELQLNREAKIPFLLQVEDVQYLIEVVWAFRSARQDSSDLDGLMFARWDRGMDWSPWNCILLSKEEASGHKEVEDIHKVYETAFISSIEYKHNLAWRHYSQIPVMAEYLNSQPAVGPNSRTVSMATNERMTNTMTH